MKIKSRGSALKFNFIYFIGVFCSKQVYYTYTTAASLIVRFCSVLTRDDTNSVANFLT